MGRIFVVELEGRCYKCKFCKTHLALVSDCVSRVLYLTLSLLPSTFCSKIVSFTVRTITHHKPLLKFISLVLFIVILWHIHLICIFEAFFRIVFPFSVCFSCFRVHMLTLLSFVFSLICYHRRGMKENYIAMLFFEAPCFEFLVFDAQIV